MKYFLFGDDGLTIRARKQEYIQAFLQEQATGQVLSFDVAQGEKAIFEKLEEEILPTLFETQKLLIIEGLESVYELNKERVEHILTSPTPHTLLFLEVGKFTKANSFLKFAKKQIEKNEEYELKKRDFTKFTAALEKEMGNSLDAQTLSIIRERSGKDDELAIQNIQKVLTYSQGEPISQAVVDVLVPAPLETKVFDALDALVGGQKERAYVLFHRILREEDIFRIFPLCAWQIRQMLLVSDEKERCGENKEKIAKNAGMHPFVVQKILRVLPNFPRSRLARGCRLLSELDTDLKLSRVTPEGALQHFVFQW